MALFKSFVLTAALSLCGASDSLRATTPRRLSYELISGYEPKSLVTDHNAIDLDQKEMETALAAEEFMNGRHFYEKGAHSKSYATLTLDTALTEEVKEGTKVTGKSYSGDADVTGEVLDTVSGGTTLKVRYDVSSVQDTYVNCQVGALQYIQKANKAGCFAENSTITIDGVGDYAYSYEVHSGNKNGRTLQGFSTSADDTMNTCKTCPYKTFKKYRRYYGVSDYGDKFVMAAFDGSKTDFPNNGNQDFSNKDKKFRRSLVEGGSVLLNVWMYVIREMEDAIDDCNAGDIGANSGGVHAWDEAVAFYNGSVEGQDGKGKGYLLHELADLTCQYFKTCGPPGDRTDGQAHVNHEIRKEFKFGQRNLIAGQCDDARQNKERIENLMAVPLIQGTLRYAYILDSGGRSDPRREAEGAAFAAAVLPLVYHCDAGDADSIFENMRVGATETTFEHVKNAFENVYTCMDVACSEVGGYYNSDAEDYHVGAFPCNSVRESDQSIQQSSSSSGGGDKNKAGIIAGVVIGILAALVIGAFVLKRRNEKESSLSIDAPKQNPTFVEASETEIS